MAEQATAERILVTGAAGKTGQAVLRALAATRAPVRAFVRRLEQRPRVEQAGASEVLAGDMRNRESATAAVQGVTAIYHICPNVHPDEIGIGRRVVAAALAARVPRIVYHSVLHPQIEAMPHHWAKLRVEELLFESGLDYTILQPAPYMQNVLGQWQAIVDEGLYEVPYSLDSRLVMVDLEDVAEVAARVLGESGHEGATYELCGPERLDSRQVAAVLQQALGRAVEARALAPRRWAERARKSGLDEVRLETLLAMFRFYDRFGLAGSGRVLDCLLGRPATTFARFTARQAA